MQERDKDSISILKFAKEKDPKLTWGLKSESNASKSFSFVLALKWSKMRTISASVRTDCRSVEIQAARNLNSVSSIVVLHGGMEWKSKVEEPEEIP